MKQVLTLLKPRFFSLRNRRVSKGSFRPEARLIIFGLVGTAFWSGIFAVFYRVLRYFRNIEEFGDILAYKLLSMSLIAFYSLLIFSALLTSLSKLYLSKDLVLVHALPVSRGKIFIARWLESSLDSSWMVIVYSLPLFLSYGIVFKSGVGYYLSILFNMVPFCFGASAISTIAVMIIAAALPAGKLKRVFIILSFILFLLLLFAFRLMRPERFANPEAFASVVLYFRAIDTSGSPLLPTTWFYDALRSALSGSFREAVFHSGLLWSFGLSMAFIAAWTADALYFHGFTKAQTSAGRAFSTFRSRKRGQAKSSSFVPGNIRAIFVKEIKVFFRDQTQWPQIFLLIGLIVIYLYNFSVLPLERSPVRTVYLQNLVSFLNMGLAAFVLTAVAARFAYPAMSIEGNAFWIVRAAPVSIRKVLWIKFFVYLLPLLLLAEILIVATNILLGVTPFMMVISAVTILFMVPGIVSLGIGMGALYPDFNSENPAQSVTSIGGLIYMTLCAGFIATVIVLEAGPVYSVFMSGLRGRPLEFYQLAWLGASFAGVIVICSAALIIPMRLGERGLSRSLD